MHVTGDRTVEHGLATVGYDDEGVADAAAGTSSADGMLVGYQLDRPIGQPRRTTTRSNGCAFADSPGHIPIQRMANVSLQPAADGPTTEELIGRRRATGSTSSATSPGRSTCSGTTSSSPVSGSTGSSNGELAGQVRDVAYQATTTDFWGSMDGGRRPADLAARRCVQLRQGPARPGRRRQPRLPDRAVPRRQHPQHRPRRAAGDRAATSPQELVERAGRVRAPTAASSIARRRQQRQPAVGQQHAHHQRGGQRASRLTVIAIVGGAEGTSAGSVIGSAASADDDLEPVVRRGGGGRHAPLRPGRGRRTAGRTGDRTDRRRLRRARRPTRRSRSSSDCSPAPRRRVRRAGAGGRGCLRLRRPRASTTTYLGSIDRAAAAARPAHRDARGHRQVRATCTRSAWVGAATRDFADVDVAAVRRGRCASGLAWAERSDRPASRAGTRRSCRRRRWPT